MQRKDITKVFQQWFLDNQHTISATIFDYAMLMHALEKREKSWIFKKNIKSKIEQQIIEHLDKPYQKMIHSLAKLPGSADIVKNICNLKSTLIGEVLNRARKFILDFDAQQAFRSLDKIAVDLRQKNIEIIAIVLYLDSLCSKLPDLGKNKALSNGLKTLYNYVKQFTSNRDKQHLKFASFTLPIAKYALPISAVLALVVSCLTFSYVPNTLLGWNIISLAGAFTFASAFSSANYSLIYFGANQLDKEPTGEVAVILNPVIQSLMSQFLQDDKSESKMLCTAKPEKKPADKNSNDNPSPAELSDELKLKVKTRGIPANNANATAEEHLPVLDEKLMEPEEFYQQQLRRQADWLVQLHIPRGPNNSQPISMWVDARHEIIENVIPDGNNHAALVTKFDNSAHSGVLQGVGGVNRACVKPYTFPFFREDKQHQLQHYTHKLKIDGKERVGCKNITLNDGSVVLRPDYFDPNAHKEEERAARRGGRFGF